MRTIGVLFILIAAVMPAAAPVAKNRAAVRAAQQEPRGATLTSGVDTNVTFFPISTATFYNQGFTIDVPPGATQLRVELTGPDSSDIDLFVRYGSDVTSDGTGIYADYYSEGLASTETITIPSPRAGTHYIDFARYTTGARSPAGFARR